MVVIMGQLESLESSVHARSLIDLSGRSYKTTKNRKVRLQGGFARMDHHMPKSSMEANRRGLSDR